MSETLSLWCSRTLKKGRSVVAVHRHCLRTSQLCRPPLGLSESLTVPILVPQDSYSLLPKGLEEGMLHVQGLHTSPETRGGCGLHGPLHEQILLEWAGMGSQRWSVHKNVLAQIHIVVRGMAEGRCCTCFQSTIDVTSPCAELGKDLQKS